jgi:TonB family protein
MTTVIAVLVWTLLEAISVIGPAYPPNAASGGNVVAVLHLSAGSVRSLDVLVGDPPFVAPVQAALKGWHFKTSENGNALVVVNFRGPTLYATGSARRELRVVGAWPGLAIPKSVIEAAYPPNSLAEGSVVLQLVVSESGSVSKAKVLQGLGNQTEACVSAVKQWQFSPAQNAKGASIPAEAYAVCVVRRPILGP